MNILTNGMSIKNIKKRERKAKLRKQKVQADQEPCTLTRKSKRKRETAIQVEGTPRPSVKLPKQKRSETRMNNAAQNTPTKRNSKSSNVGETKTKTRLPRGRSVSSVVTHCLKNICKKQKNG